MRFVARSVAGGPALGAVARSSNRQTLSPRLGARRLAHHPAGASGSVTLSSKRLVDDPRPIILAWTGDGAELTGKAAPLRPAGGSLTSARRLFAIKSISLQGVPT